MCLHVLPAEQKADPSAAVDNRLISTLAQRLAGGVVGLGTLAIVKFYQYVVDPAAPNTWPTRFFTWAAAGPIR